MGLGRGGGDGDIAVDEGICEGAQEREIGAFSVGELMLRSCDETGAFAAGLRLYADIIMSDVAGEFAKFWARVEVQGVTVEEEAAAAFCVRVGGNGLRRLHGKGHANGIVERRVRKVVLWAAQVQAGPHHGAWVVQGHEVRFVERVRGFVEQALQDGVLVSGVEGALEVIGLG